MYNKIEENKVSAAVICDYRIKITYSITDKPEAKKIKINDSITIKTSQAVSKESFMNFLVCLICGNIVEDAQQCSKCDNLLCNHCMIAHT